jgi:flagellar protein FliJ
MKRYSFPLAQVLRVRRLEEDRAAGRLATARVEAAAAEERLARRQDTLAGMAPPAGVGTAGAFLAWHQSVALAGEALTAAGAARHVAVAEVDARRDEWSSAAMRVSALERLDERRLEAHTKEARRTEAVQVDDMVTARRRDARGGVAGRHETERS